MKSADCAAAEIGFAGKAASYRRQSGGTSSASFVFMRFGQWAMSGKREEWRNRRITAIMQWNKPRERSPMGNSLDRLILDDLLFDSGFEHRSLPRRDTRKVYRAQRNRRLRATELRYRRERAKKKKLGLG
jgi:hypothetical protein